MPVKLGVSAWVVPPTPLASAADRPENRLPVTPLKKPLAEAAGAAGVDAARDGDGTAARPAVAT